MHVSPPFTAQEASSIVLHSTPPGQSGHIRYLTAASFQSTETKERGFDRSGTNWAVVGEG